MAGKGEEGRRWGAFVKGVPIEAIVRLKPGGGKKDVLVARNRVTLIPPGSVNAQADNEHEVEFCYGPEATEEDIYGRSVQPLMKRLVDGYNAAVVLLGATGSGKTHTLEGRAAAGAGSEGLVSHVIEGLFSMLHQKASHVGDKVAARRRNASARGFDFFVETRYMEVYNEQCRDLYNDTGLELRVREDQQEGVHVQGLSTRGAADPAELLAHFREGQAARNTQQMDLGSVHERAASIFYIMVSQFQPAVNEGEDDRHLVSQLMLVDTPGSERLAMDPEVLRLREGITLNKGILSLGSTVRKLSSNQSLDYVNYGESVLTQLLSPSLGGDCFTMFIGTLNPGHFEQNNNTMTYVDIARKVSNYPVLNNERLRGLMQRHRNRLLQALDQKAALGDQLQELPAGGAGGGAGDLGMMKARVHDLEGRLIEEREEKAGLEEEKRALQRRLQSLAGSDKELLDEKEELQGALVRSEEERLEIANALIELQVEHSHLQEEFETTKFELEERILELEAHHLEADVRVQETDDRLGELELAGLELTTTRDELTDANKRLISELEGLKAQLEEDTEAAARLKKEHEELTKQVARDKDTVGRADENARAAAESSRENAELKSELDKTKGNLADSENERTKATLKLQDARVEYQKRTQMFLRELGELAKMASIAAKDPESPIIQGLSERLAERAGDVADEIARAQSDRERDHGEALDKVQQDYHTLLRRHRALYQGYRQLRYKMDDVSHDDGGKAGSHVLHEDEIVGGVQDEVDADEGQWLRDSVAQLRERNQRIEAQLNRARLAMNGREAGAAGGGAGDGGGKRSTSRAEVHAKEALARMEAKHEAVVRELAELRTGQSPSEQGLREENAQLVSQVAGLEEQVRRMREHGAATPSTGRTTPQGLPPRRGGGGGGEAADIRSELEVARAQLASAERRAEAGGAGAVANLEGALREAEAAAESLREENGRLRSQARRSSSRVAPPPGSAEIDLRRENESLRSRLHRAEEERAGGRDSGGHGGGGEASELRSENAELRERLRQAQREAQQGGGSEEEARSMRSEIQNLRAELARAESSAKRAESDAQRAAAGSRGGLQEAMEQNGNLQKIIQRLQGELEAAREAAEAQRAAAGHAPPSRAGSSRGGPRAGAFDGLIAENAELKAEISDLRLRNQEAGGTDRLREENERLQSQIDRLQSDPSVQSDVANDALRRENQRLRAQIEEIRNGDRSRTQMGYEIAQLKEQLEAAKGSQKQKEAMGKMKQQIREFTMQTQSKLEAESAELRSRVAVADAQAEEMQQYMARSTLTYQQEIMRLRGIVGKYEPSSVQAPPGAGGMTAGAVGGGAGGDVGGDGGAWRAA